MRSYLPYRDPEDRGWVLLYYIVPAILMMSIPILSWLVNVITLLVQRSRSPWLRFHSIQALVLNLIALGVYFSMFLTVLVAIPLLTVPIMTNVVMIIMMVLVSIQYLMLFLLSCYLAVTGILVYHEVDHRVPLVANWVESHFI